VLEEAAAAGLGSQGGGAHETVIAGQPAGRPSKHPLSKGAAASLDRMLGGDGNMFAAFADESDSDSDGDGNGDSNDEYGSAACVGDHVSSSSLVGTGDSCGADDAVSEAETCTCADLSCCGGAGGGE